jgi:flagellar protein FliS
MDHVISRQQAKMYRKVAAQTSVETAGPHRLIQMLLQGVIDKLSIARGLMQNELKADASKTIGMAMAIIDTLRMSLDKSIGDEVTQNLNDLYEFSNQHLLEASLKQTPQNLDEVMTIIREIKAGWDAIPEETIREFEAKLPKA